MSDYKLIRGQTVRFLLGEEGSFERPPGEGRFWWRNALRNGIVGYHEADSEQVDALQSDLTAAKAEIERLRGRLAMQAEAYQSYIETGFDELLDPIIDANIGSEAWLLRKQAEAVEAWLNGNAEMGELTDYAQSLRQQADELDND